MYNKSSDIPYQPSHVNIILLIELARLLILHYFERTQRKFFATHMGPNIRNRVDSIKRINGLHLIIDLYHTIR